LHSFLLRWFFVLFFQLFLVLQIINCWESNNKYPKILTHV
jgi:hypothetical protein